MGSILTKKEEGTFFRKRRLPSFLFSGLLLVFFLSSCAAFHPKADKVLWEKKRVGNLERIQRERRIIFAVLRDSPQEKEITSFAGKAARLLGLEMIVLRSSWENIPSLLRSNRADFAWSNSASIEEAKSLFLLPLEVEEKGKEEKYIFLFPRNGEDLRSILKEALTESAVKKGTGHEFRQ